MSFGAGGEGGDSIGMSLEIGGPEGKEAYV